MKMQKYDKFVKKSLKITMQKTKHAVILEIIVTIRMNTEVLHVAHVIYNVVHLKKLP